MRPPLRMQAVQTPIIPVVADWIRQNPGTISLGQGVVSYGPPPEASAEIARFFADPENHKYKPVHGLPELLEAITTKLKTENGISLGAGNRLIVTAGGNMAFMNAVLAITDPGDEVILQSPCYFNHEMAVTMASARPVLAATDENYQLRLDAIRAAITTKTRAIVTVSPNNPSGAVYSESALRAVNSLCRERGLYHIHDEAYENFVYSSELDPQAPAGLRHFSPASIPDSAPHTISLFSLSKAYGFASWRIGYMVAPEALFDSIRKIQDTILICAPVISQFAARGALRAGSAYCRERLRNLAEVRQIVLAELATLGELCRVPRADGAFYFLLQLPAGKSPIDLAERLVREHRVAAIPGTAFGLSTGCHLRISYGALPKDQVVEGIGRLVRGLRSILSQKSEVRPSSS